MVLSVHTVVLYPLERQPLGSIKPYVTTGYEPITSCSRYPGGPGKVMNHWPAKSLGRSATLEGHSCPDLHRASGRLRELPKSAGCVYGRNQASQVSVIQRVERISCACVSHVIKSAAKAHSKPLRGLHISEASQLQRTG